MAPRPDPRSLAAAFEEAVAFHRAGRLREAAAGYQAVLAADPSHPEALHRLGLVALQAGDAAAAIDLIGRAVRARGDAPAYHLSLGEAHRQAGDLAAAGEWYERAHALDPGNPGALNNLGNLRMAEGRPDAALPHYEALVKLRPDWADGHYNLANALRATARPQEAVAGYRQALALAPGHPGALVNLGQTLVETGAAGEAVPLIREALVAAPALPEAHYALGDALRVQGDLAGAVESYRQALHHRPDFLEAIFNLGAALQEAGEYGQAESCYRRVLGLDPGHARAHNNLGAVLAEQTRHDEAIQAYERAVALDPGDAEAQANLGNAFLEQGRIEEAAARYRRSLDIAPDDGVEIKLATLLPVIPMDEAEIAAARARYEEGLDRLIAKGPRLTDPVKEIGKTSFYLTYHGLDDRALQRKQATLYARACPELLYEAPHIAGWRGAEGRIRVGFVSRFLRDHTIGRFMQGVIGRLDRSRFHVTVFFYPQPMDALAGALAEGADEAVMLPPELSAVRERIAQARLDALHFADIGMEPASYFLGFARLAPVQCVFWGHPETTGLANMDYFLSGATLEVETADEHYSEALVRLPTYNTCYARPVPADPLPTRAGLGLPEDGTLYICPQSLFKFHPTFDALLRAVLEGDGSGTLALLGGTNPHWTGLLADRLRRTMGAVFERVRFLERLSHTEFLGLLAIADVMLGTTVFSGANSTLEGLAMGTPVVTLPSQFLRGRLSYGCYEKMGMMDLVAKDEAGYVRIALRLGTDPGYRAAMRARILAESHVLYDDDRPVRELEGFLAAAVARRGEGKGAGRGTAAARRSGSACRGPGRDGGSGGS